jgi:hypothetical protein
MIRHIVVLYLAIASALVIGPDPLWILPLVLVSASYISGSRYLGLIGILGFFTVTLGRVPDRTFTDLQGLSMIVIGLIAPGAIALDLVLSDRPYLIDRFRTVPIGVSVLLIGGMVVSMAALSRVQRIGIYLNSDPLLQVFIAISLALLFTGPVLLTRGAPGKGQI